MKTGQFLALCREIKGLSLREVEKRTGVSNAALSQIETGQNRLSPSADRWAKRSVTYSGIAAAMSKQWKDPA